MSGEPRAAVLGRDVIEQFENLEINPARIGLAHCENALACLRIANGKIDESKNMKTLNSTNSAPPIAATTASKKPQSVSWEPTEEEIAKYHHAANQPWPEMPEEEAEKYRAAGREYDEEAPARLAAVLSNDNVYLPYMGEMHRLDLEAQLRDMSPTPAINLPAVIEVPHPQIIKPKPTSITEIYDKPPYHIILGDCVMYVIRYRGGDLMFTQKGAYRYSNGLWSMETEGLAAWLNVEIEIAAKKFRQVSSIKLINETRAWIQRQEQLHRNHDDIKWDAHGMVPTKSGLVNPRTLEVRPIQPDDYCTWRIEAEYDPMAKCPWWMQMLADVFADRSDAERTATIAVIQELLGAGLLNDKPRELSKAMVLLGGSNFGKSGLLEVLGGLFGQEVNSTTIEALEGAHGKMSFLKRLPWVLHEAFDQRKWHFSSDVKTIITGEPIYVNIKNGPILSIRFGAPIFWGTNHPPQFKESTRAVTNRLVVIECKREFFGDNPVGAAKEAFRRGLGKPSSLVLKEEMPGLLAWAVVGLKRALERGRLILTKQMSDSIDEIRRDSNLVDGFLTDCCYYDPDRRLAVPDFCLAFATWWLENKGENRTPPSNEAIGKALVAMADPKIAIGGEELRDTRRRYHVGLVLNDEGLAFHAAGYEMPDLRGKTANATDPKSQVNSPIPPQWLEKESIKTMRKRQEPKTRTVENGL